MDTTSFAVATALRPIADTSPARFAGEADPRWTIGGKPNGGYLLAMLGRAAVATGHHPHVLAASAHFLRPPEPGPLEVEVDVLRAGRGASQLRVRLVQDGRACVEALLTTGELDPGVQPYWSSPAGAAGVRSPDGEIAGAVRLPGVNPAGIPVPIMDQVELRIDRETLGWAGGHPSGRGELRGWLGLSGGEPHDAVSLLYAVDAFPPATFDVELTGWVPTLELTAYVRALPAPGPLRIRQTANLIEAGRVDEQCWVWDSRGRLVAQATQLAGIRLG